MSRPVRITVTAAVAVLVSFGVLAACTADDAEPSSPTSSTPTGGSSQTQEPDEGWTRAEIAEALFGGDIGTTTALGSAEGAVPDRVSPRPAVIEVTEVVAGAASTLVRFTLKNVDDSDPLLSLDAFNSAAPLTRDVRDIALVDTEQNARLQPFLGRPLDGDLSSSFCTCANALTRMSQVGQLISATFPPLSDRTTTVSLEVPGFPLIEDLEVTRR